MNTMKWLMMLALLVAAGCGDDPSVQPTAERSKTGPLVVATVNYPLAYMAERIGGEQVEVVFPAPANVDPAFWQPAADDVVAMQAADLILLNGAGYAGWTRTATLPASRIVDTSAAFPDRLIAREDLVTHTHGPSGDHAHGSTAFTTWLDLDLAVLHAAAIRDTFARLRPSGAAVFAANFDGLETDVRALDARLAAAVAKAPDRVVIFSHPVYDYLARRYGMKGHSLHWEPGEAPTAEQWSEFDRIARDHSAGWMIWEGEPLPATVADLERRGVRGAVFAPCGNRPQDGDLLSALEASAAALERVYGPAK